MPAQKEQPQALAYIESDAPWANLPILPHANGFSDLPVGVIDNPPFKHYYVPLCGNDMMVPEIRKEIEEFNRTGGYVAAPKRR